MLGEQPWDEHGRFHSVQRPLIGEAEQRWVAAGVELPLTEAQIDTALVSALLRQQHANLGMLPLRPVHSGSHTVMFRLGESFAVRLPRSEIASRRLANEQRWLMRLSDRLPLPIPGPLRVGQPALGFPWPWSVVPWLLGKTAQVAPVSASEARRLGEFLRALHSQASADAPKNLDSATPPLASRASALEERMRRLAGAGELVAPRVRKAWEEALTSPIEVQPTWIHGALHARNVLTLEGTVTGVIDWGDIACGDPAKDLACVWMLLPDALARNAAMTAYGATSDAVWLRARGWAILFAITSLDDGLCAGRRREVALAKQLLRRI
jgi:aminoglycoside phosphotransferase (APT) family kinase protein